MKVYRKYFLIVLLIMSKESFASNSDIGDISLIHAVNNGAVIFYHNGVRSSDIPVCGTGQSGRWVIDATALGGKSQLSVLLTAYAKKYKISIVGSGICDIWGDTETVRWFVVRD